MPLAGKLTLNYGVQPSVIPFHEVPEENIREGEQQLLNRGILPRGACMIVLSDIKVDEKFFYTVPLRRLGQES